MQKTFFAKCVIFGLSAILLVGGFCVSFINRHDNIVFADGLAGDGVSKLITIHDEGSKVLLQTRAGTVQEVLQVAGIDVNEFDRVEPYLEDIIDESGFVINVYRAQPVLVRDGTTRIMAMSGARDPRNIVHSLGIVVSEYDEIYFRDLSILERLESGLKQEVVIDRVASAVEEEEEIIEEEAVEESTSAPVGIPVDRSFNMDGFDCMDGNNDSLNNEACTWHFFRARGFSAIATAGIMGNFQQEHRFKTADVPGGLGIAQWMGGRRTRLLEMENPFWISTQLEFVMIELNGSYWRVRDAMHSATTVEEATRIFQNQYEKCGVCKEESRIRFAWELFHKYTEQ